MQARQFVSMSLAAVFGASLGFIALPTILRSDSDSANLVLASESRSHPVRDNNGNYHPSDPDNSYMPWEWEVVDPDPNGLNCRYYNRREGSPTGGKDIYNYPVSYTMNQGQTFYSPTITYDDRGLPWLWVGTSNTTQICYVRANSRFVRPVRALDRYL